MSKFISIFMAAMAFVGAANANAVPRAGEPVVKVSYDQCTTTWANNNKGKVCVGATEFDQARACLWLPVLGAKCVKITGCPAGNYFDGLKQSWPPAPRCLPCDMSCDKSGRCSGKSASDCQFCATGYTKDAAGTCSIPAKKYDCATQVPGWGCDTCDETRPAAGQENSNNPVGFCTKCKDSHNDVGGGYCEDKCVNQYKWGCKNCDNMHHTGANNQDGWCDVCPDTHYKTDNGYCEWRCVRNNEGWGCLDCDATQPTGEGGRDGLCKKCNPETHTGPDAYGYCTPKPACTGTGKVLKDGTCYACSSSHAYNYPCLDCDGTKCNKCGDSVSDGVWTYSRDRNPGTKYTISADGKCVLAN